jgi:hypothetical protein
MHSGGGASISKGILNHDLRKYLLSVLYLL